jgi:hypothetical protein
MAHAVQLTPSSDVPTQRIQEVEASGRWSQTENDAQESNEDGQVNVEESAAALKMLQELMREKATLEAELDARLSEQQVVASPLTPDRRQARVHCPEGELTSDGGGVKRSTSPRPVPTKSPSLTPNTRSDSAELGALAGVDTL